MANKTSNVRIGEYNGHPLLVFGKKDDRFPFQFGAAKAKQLLAAIDEMGAVKFRAFLAEFVNENGKGGSNG